MKTIQSVRKPLFISGIGTGIGKTMVAAIMAQALKADYWKPVQAGFDTGTDSEWLSAVVTNKTTRVHPEVYKFKLAASPHIAAREEGVRINLDAITERLPSAKGQLIIEGAGGLMVPLNENEFVIDLIEKLNPRVILVSRNYLGSINHSLLTASLCKSRGLDVAGWIFNDQYLDYTDEIVKWSGIPKLVSIPFCEDPGADFIQEQAILLHDYLQPLI